MKAATIYDVAREAGVSHQTVSRYLQGYEGIRPKTREKVRKALSTLDYKPNSAARLLRASKVNRIAVLAHRIDEAGPVRILHGATAYAQTRGYVADVIALDGNDAESIDAAIDIAIDHQIAGLLASAQTDVVLDRLQARALQLPLVVNGHLVDPTSHALVSSLAGREAAELLVSLGHRRLGYLAGPPSWFSAQEREQGFRSAAEEAGAVVAWLAAGDWSAESGHAAWDTGAVTASEITAIGVGNDSMAIGLVAAAQEAGVSVPHALSVVGTDDLPEGRYLFPSGLSTVSIDFEGEGALLMAQLIDQIDGLASGLHQEYRRLPQRLARGSTKPIRE